MLSNCFVERIIYIPGAGFSAAASPERRYEGGQKLLKQLTEGSKYFIVVLGRFEQYHSS